MFVNNAFECFYSLKKFLYFFIYFSQYIKILFILLIISAVFIAILVFIIVFSKTNYQFFIQTAMI